MSYSKLPLREYKEILKGRVFWLGGKGVILVRLGCFLLRFTILGVYSYLLAIGVSTKSGLCLTCTQLDLIKWTKTQPTVDWRGVADQSTSKRRKPVKI